MQYLNKENLNLFGLLSTPVWIFDIDNLKMYWANEAAVKLWQKKDLSELLNQDFSDISEATGYRFNDYLERFKREEKISEQWTFYPDNKTVTVDCIFTGVIIENNYNAMLIEGIIPKLEKIENDTLRGVEALRHTSVLVSLYTLDGKLIMQNPAAFEAYNNNDENDSLFDKRFINHSQAQEIIDYISNDKIYSSQVQVKTSKGSRWHDINARMTNDPVSGESIILVNESDITERKNAEEALRQSEEKFRNSFDYSAIGMALLDLSGKFIKVNQSLCKIFNLSEEELLNKNFRELTHPDDLAQDLIKIDELLSGKIISFEREKRYVTNNKNIICGHTSISVIKDFDGNPLYFITQVQDISKRKKAENDIIKFNSELEHKINIQTAELKRSNEELQQFAYVASHDIQEPLRMIASYVQLLQKRYKDKLDQDANDYIGFAVEGVSRMQNMLQGILQYSRIGTKIRPFTDTDFNELIELVLVNLSLLIRENNAVITYDKLPVLKVDENQMIQLFQNLISNAIKYKREEAPKIHISVVKEGEKYIFSVTDNGIGIDKYYFDRIFTIFQRLHSRSEYSGSGIGLAICKKIVERHHGKIWVESEEGKGTTFFFSLENPSSGKNVLEEKNTVQI